MSKENIHNRRRHLSAWALLGAIYGMADAQPAWRKADKAKSRSNWTRPHQGNAECERRLAKIKAGQIPRDQVLIRVT